jgi:hypothetical protein
MTTEEFVAAITAAYRNLPIKPCRGHFIEQYDDEEPVLCCAVGALAYSIGVRPNWGNYKNDIEAPLVAKFGLTPKQLKSISSGFEGLWLEDSNYPEWHEAGQLLARTFIV